jgi:hypothetical protein
MQEKTMNVYYNYVFINAVPYDFDWDTWFPVNDLQRLMKQEGNWMILSLLLYITRGIN